MSRKQFSVLEDPGAIFVEVQNIYGLYTSIFLNSIKNLDKYIMYYNLKN